nr:TM2 domain-containing protein [Clostridium sp. 1001271B_151109_B4]
MECCEFCGADLNDNRYAARENVKSKLIAVFLALFLGGMGIHRFYLGYVKIGIVQLSLWILGYFTGGITWIIAEIWGFVECILIYINKLKDSNGNDLE